MQNSYIDHPSASTYVYEPANELAKVKSILSRSKNSISQINSKLLGNNYAGNNLRKKQTPFSFLALNDMKERKRAMNHKRVPSLN